MNQVIIIGNICNDLELRYTSKNNKEVCQFTIAVNQQERTDFIPCVVYGVQAKNLCSYQKKGSKIAISGTLRVDNFEVEGQKRNKTYVLANNIEYLSNKNTNETQEAPVEESKIDPFAKVNVQNIPISDDDLPF